MNKLNGIATWIATAALCLGFAARLQAAETAVAPAPSQAVPVAAGEAGAAKVADRTLKGDEACTRCHDESEEKAILSFYRGRHGVKSDDRAPGCQSCHGTSEKHLASKASPPDVVFGKGKGKSAPEAQSAVCITCHQADKNGRRSLWEGSQHQSSNLACTSCHSNHTRTGDPILNRVTQREVCFQCHKTERAETMRVSTHPIAAGKVVCADCHNPHGSEGPKLMLDVSIRDTCFGCHAEKRGPFLWEHPSAMDDCTNCHTPHGSTNAPLLKARAPWLCQSCHGDGAPHPGNVYSANSLPDGPVANVTTLNSTLSGVINPVTGAGIALNNPPPQLAFRACTNCHTQVHGSNHPAGRRFVR